MYKFRFLKKEEIGWDLILSFVFDLELIEWLLFAIGQPHVSDGLPRPCARRDTLQDGGKLFILIKDY